MTSPPDFAARYTPPLFTPESRLWSLDPLMIVLSIIPSNDAILDRADITRGMIPLNFFHNSVRIGHPVCHARTSTPLPTETRKSYSEPNSWPIPLQGRRNHFHGLQPSLRYIFIVNTVVFALHQTNQRSHQTYKALAINLYI